MNGERVAVAQVASVRGDVARNIAAHAEAMRVARERGVSFVVFPELSLTGYELGLASSLAMRADDSRLKPLVDLARAYELGAVVGTPLQSGLDKPYLGAVIISGDGAVSTYRKMHLGGDEPDFFAPGDCPKVVSLREHTVGLAICADTAKPSHPETCIALGANIYAAGAFLTKEWYEGDSPRLQDYAKRYGITVLMANHGSSVGTLESWGRSAVWAPNGDLLSQVSGTQNALLIAESLGDRWRAQCVEF